MTQTATPNANSKRPASCESWTITYQGLRVIIAERHIAERSIVRSSQRHIESPKKKAPQRNRPPRIQQAPRLLKKMHQRPPTESRRAAAARA